MNNYQKFFLFVCTLIFTGSVFGQFKEESHELFTEILSDYVKSGLVDYENLAKDDRLGKYINQISSINPDEITGEKNQLAFWLNVYNAYTLKIIIDNYPLESINELHKGGRVIAHILGTTVWDKELLTINEKKTNLNYVEHEVIRVKFNEPRIHFALVCAALSCPDLRNEAYEGYKLDAQLEDQTKIFFNNPSKNRFDFNTRTAYLSKIMDWYDDDFGKSDEEILSFVAQ